MIRTSSLVRPDATREFIGILSAIVLLTGCAAGNLGPVAVGTQVVADENWKPMWADLEACTGITGDFARLHVYQSADGTLSGEALGRWVAPHNIYLADYVFETKFTAIVLHEMIHDLIGVSDPNHLNPLWKKCDPNYAFIEEKNR